MGTTELARCVSLFALFVGPMTQMVAGAVIRDASIAKGVDPSSAFVSVARKSYATKGYSDYTNSVVSKFLVRAADFADRPVAGGIVKWWAVEGARNVRDIGGWTGLAAGRAYRGSELNYVRDHGLQLTDFGRRTMLEWMKVKTDLDLRGAEFNERGIYTNCSPISASIRYLNVSIGSYSAIHNDPQKFAEAVRVFANSANYPIYFHCWGGADRTGSLAFILEGLCGVSEADLSIDYELTSFAAVFGERRRDLDPARYAALIGPILSMPGKALVDKFGYYAKNTLKLTDEEIAAIRRNLGMPAKRLKPIEGKPGKPDQKGE